MLKLSLSKKLLWGRFLTRTGDQAWDFALPLVLLYLFPNQLKYAAIYYFIVRLLNTLLLPRLSTLIDRWNRKKAVQLGIYLQLFGVVIGLLSVYFFIKLMAIDAPMTNVLPLMLGGAFVIGGVLSSLGTSFMDIAIANDLVPSSIADTEMTSFNSHLRQVDLFTEVMSPFLAGLVLSLSPDYIIGFIALAIWNLVSFFPELSLLNSIFKERPDLRDKPLQIDSQLQKTLTQKLTEGWKDFFHEPVALVCLAYAILWLSVLSPHGVLLTAFLKDAWHLPEWAIGVFRGAGALFGLCATVLFPPLVKRYGLQKASMKFILFQSITLVVGLVFFYLASDLNIWAQVGFLSLILFSRIGLYGFSLGEMQIRQIEITPNVRGRVNGFATALTGFATLFLYGAGALLPETTDFKYLVVASVAFVCFAGLVYFYWLKNRKAA